MSRFTILCIFCLAACCTMTYTAHSDDSGRFITDLLANQRTKRSLKLIGLLLNEARLMLRDRNFRKFSKKGGYNTALEDFERLGPKNVRVVGRSVAGQVGDRTVIIVGNPINGAATMDVLKHVKTKTGQSTIDIDRIQYAD